MNVSMFLSLEHCCINSRQQFIEAMKHSIWGSRPDMSGNAVIYWALSGSVDYPMRHQLSGRGLHTPVILRETGYMHPCSALPIIRFESSKRVNEENGKRLFTLGSQPLHHV